MPPGAGLRFLSREFGTARRAEADPKFRDVIHDINRRSLIVVGALGFLAPLIFMGMQVIVWGKDIAWEYGSRDATEILVIYDKVLILLMGLLCLVLAGNEQGRRWGRLIVAATIVVAGIASLSDDIANANLVFSAGYLAVLMFASTAVPFRPGQMLALCLTISGLYPTLVYVLPPLAGWERVAMNWDHFVFLLIVTLACTGLTALMYNYRYGQHRAVKREAAANKKLRETQAQLVQSAKMASLGNLVAGIAHEINTPLGAIRSGAGTIATGLDKLAPVVADTEQAKTVAVLQQVNEVGLSASERIDKIVRSLRNFARLDEADRKAVDLHEGITSTLAILPLPPGKEIEIECRFGDLPEVTCHPNQINQVFMHLLQNGMEAIDSSGRIIISTAYESDRVKVIIADTGRGIPGELSERVFDPGFTTKGVGVGTGLGLSICYRIIEEHGGEIVITSRPGHGTEVEVCLPVRT